MTHNYEELIDQVAKVVTKTMVSCGVIKKPVDDPWVVGPSILIARAILPILAIGNRAGLF